MVCAFLWRRFSWAIDSVTFLEEQAVTPLRRFTGVFLLVPNTSAASESSDAQNSIPFTFQVYFKALLICLASYLAKMWSGESQQLPTDTAFQKYIHHRNQNLNYGTGRAFTCSVHLLLPEPLPLTTKVENITCASNPFNIVLRESLSMVLNCLIAASAHSSETSWNTHNLILFHQGQVFLATGFLTGPRNLGLLSPDLTNTDQEEECTEYLGLFHVFCHEISCLKLYPQNLSSVSVSRFIPSSSFHKFQYLNNPWRDCLSELIP